MFTFKTDDSGDVVFENNILQSVSRQDMDIQTFRQLFSTRKGEYFLNSKEGLDFSPFFGRKDFNKDEATAALQDVGRQIPSFLEFKNIEYIIDNSTRKLQIIMEIVFADGTEATIQERMVL